MLFRWVELKVEAEDDPHTDNAHPTTTYVGVAGVHAVEMTETGSTVFYRVLGGSEGEDDQDEAASVVKQELLSLFSAASEATSTSRAPISRATLDPQFAAADHAFRDRAALYRGLRVIHGDLFETIVSFLGSGES